VELLIFDVVFAELLGGDADELELLRHEIIVVDVDGILDFDELEPELELELDLDDVVVYLWGVVESLVIIVVWKEEDAVVGRIVEFSEHDVVGTGCLPCVSVSTDELGVYEADVDVHQECDSFDVDRDSDAVALGGFGVLLLELSSHDVSARITLLRVETKTEFDGPEIPYVGTIGSVRRTV